MSSRVRMLVLVTLLALGIPMAYVVGQGSVSDDPAANGRLDRFTESNHARIAQRNDAEAKRVARELIAVLEQCHAQSGEYTTCDLTATGLPIGVTTGYVSASALSDETYIVSSYSRTGCTFVEERTRDGVVRTANGEHCSSTRW
ncbi:MAG: hypothetical protein JHC95_00100 [Solirubrobacteraceae bacterium]|nr:hypothetical protein [Solirubrobacteraceae bacterium]